MAVAMRKRLLLIPLLWCAQAFGITALGPDTPSHTGGADCNIIASVNSANSALIVGGTNTVPNTLTISDTDGDTFTSAFSQFCEATNANCMNAWVVNWKNTNASENIDIHGTSTTNWIFCLDLQYSGFSSNATVDKFASASFTTTTAFVTGTTATTTAANEALIGIITVKADPSTTSTGSGYGNFISTNASPPFALYALEDQVVSSTGAYQATMTGTNAVTGGGMIVTLKQGGGGAAVPGTTLLPKTAALLKTTVL